MDIVVMFGMIFTCMWSEFCVPVKCLPAKSILFDTLIHSASTVNNQSSRHLHRSC